MAFNTFSCQAKAEGNLWLCPVSRHTFAFVLVTVIPSEPTLPSIEQKCSHRAVAADNTILEFFEQVHPAAPD